LSADNEGKLEDEPFEDSSEEDLDEPDHYENDGFVVEEDEGEEPEGSNLIANQEDEGRRKKRKRAKTPREELDEEDLMLIAENTGGEFLPRKTAIDTKFKRLKKIRNDLGDLLEDEDENAHTAAESDRFDEATFEKDVFGDGAAPPSHRYLARVRALSRRAFVLCVCGGGGEHRRRRRKRATRRRKRPTCSARGGI